jgi:hypothetical protein
MADFDFSRPDWRQRIREGASLCRRPCCQGLNDRCSGVRGPRQRIQERLPSAVSGHSMNVAPTAVSPDANTMHSFEPLSE